MYLVFSYLVRIHWNSALLAYTDVSVHLNLACMYLASDRAMPQKGYVTWQTQSLPRWGTGQFPHWVWAEFRDAAVLSVIHLQRHLQSTLPPSSPKPVLFANAWLQTRRGSKYIHVFFPQNEPIASKQWSQPEMHIPQAIKFTEETLQLRLCFQMQIRVWSNLWSNLFSGQISVSKNTSPPSQFYFWICLFSTVHLMCFSASRNDFAAQSCPTLPFPTFTQTEVLQHLISNLHFWTKAL